MEAIALSELRRHVPAVDHRGLPAACSCGWRSGYIPPDELHELDYWWKWIQHLNEPAKLVVDDADRAFLKALKIGL
jgi:hypothetical protein